ncbi:hypothetical protein BB560_004179 [Smittium megazygosporum]|uniref:Uncharacterized protein n=1 Tax=Smittium megazygosporum TaxID=133381 RepID=A0A2T9ZA08_9FUNG|nr:hypothetical protein BB560_004179 [Smittium megazygosporum]
MGAISKTVYYEYNQGIPFDKVPTGFYKDSVAILDYPAFSTKHGRSVEIVCQKAYHNAIANEDYTELNSCFERQENPLSGPELKSHEADLKTPKRKKPGIQNKSSINDPFVISKFLSDNELDGICIIWDYKEKTLEDVSGIREMINQLKSIINNNKDVSVLIKAPEEKEKDLYEYFANNIMKSQFKPNTVYFLATRNSTHVENELKDVYTLLTEPKRSYRNQMTRPRKPWHVKNNYHLGFKEPGLNRFKKEGI